MNSLRIGFLISYKFKTNIKYWNKYYLSSIDNFFIKKWN